LNIVSFFLFWSSSSSSLDMSVQQQVRVFFLFHSHKMPKIEQPSLLNCFDYAHFDIQFLFMSMFHLQSLSDTSMILYSTDISKAEFFCLFSSSVSTLLHCILVLICYIQWFCILCSDQLCCKIATRLIYM